MATTLTRRSLEIASPTVPRKVLKRSKSPRQRRQNVSSLQTYKIIFEFGPPELNLFKYISKKASILWEEAKEKCILKDSGKPTDGLLLICGGEGHVEDCLKIFGFDVYLQEKLFETDSVMDDQPKSVCIFYDQQFWKSMSTAQVQKIQNTIKRASYGNEDVFFMAVSDNERDKAIECCKRLNLCAISNIISPASNKTFFYEAFYKVLDKNLQTFSTDLEIRTSTRQIHAIKCKLHSLIGKLQSRNASVKSQLTNHCLEIIKAARKNGVVGYRLDGNELLIYGDEQMTTGTADTLEIENSIKESFKGRVHFRSFDKDLKPQCTVKCGDYLQNNTTGRKGTVGIFGEVKTAIENDIKQTVALSSGHVINSGDIACSCAGGRFGECIWPESSANIHDVAVVRIDSSLSGSLNRTFFNEQIMIEEIPKEDLLHRQVFKYGATTQRTNGWIEQVDHFNLFGSDVMRISPDKSESLFSKNGDSGAIVLTILNGKHHGIGVIYGGQVNDREAKHNIPEDETIATFLKKAVERFKNEKKMTITFDKI